VDTVQQTEVEVRFVADGARRTRVELEHRHLDRFGARRDEMWGVLDSTGGWTGLLALYGKAVLAAGASVATGSYVTEKQRSHGRSEQA
jgi:hypothetical protein